VNIKDSGKVIEKLHSGQLFDIELGCGDRKRAKDAIGIDLLDYDCVDLVGDIFEVLNEFPDASVSAVYSYHFIEHINDLDKLMDELVRILIPGGKVLFTVPHFSNPYFYSDYTHKLFFGLYTFCYFCDSILFKRMVPSYQKDLRFELIDVKLIFKSCRPFYFRYGIKKLIEKIFNLSSYTKELYEENFCYLFPAYEIKYVMKKKYD
jgi:ubiquinone/menaquinone biosynthesis C-methylase UbiE